MKILIVNQFFYPDIAATAQLLTDLTEDLGAKGLDITVLTSSSSYLGGKLDLSQNGRYVGARIIRVPSTSFGRRLMVGRAIDYLTFYCLVAIRSLLLPRFDTAMLLSTPPLVSLLGVLLKFVKKTKYVCLVEDLYPDVAIALNFMKPNGLTARCSSWLSEMVYRRSDIVIAISANMRNKLIEKGVRQDKIRMVDNWADKKNLYPVPKEKNWFIRKHRLERDFVVQYSGNMGLGHEFDTMLEGAWRLRDRSDIKFVFIGDGKLKSSILEFKNRKNLANLHLMPYQKRCDLPFSLSAADVALITLREQLDGCMLPSKLFGILAAACPIIFVGSRGGDIARIIAAANCGYQVDEGDSDKFVELILNLYENPGEASKLGKNGYEYFLKRYERQMATSRYYDILSSL